MPTASTPHLERSGKLAGDNFARDGDVDSESRGSGRPLDRPETIAFRFPKIGPEL